MAEKGKNLKKFIQRLQTAYEENENARRAIIKIEKHLTQRHAMRAIFQAERLTEALLTG